MFVEQTSANATVAAGTGLALLVALSGTARADASSLPDELAAALADVGDPEGETWLNLLGVALDAGPPYTATRLLGALAALDAIELRRHLLGRYAWSWCTLGGVENIEAAASGDAEAIERLLAHPRYYAGRARASLGVLAPLDPRETKRRIVAAVEAGAASLSSATSAGALERAESRATSALAALPVLAAVEELTGGFRYVPEPEAESVVLVPHLEDDVGLVLAQHRTARLVVYRGASDRDPAERLLALGRALSDPKRVELLGLIGRGVGRPAELVAATGLARSTVHHHLALLREGGLVALEGNARAYTYVPRRAAADEAAALVAELTRTKEE